MKPEQPFDTFRTDLEERWIAFLDERRASLDAACKTGIQLIEQSFRAADVRSPEEGRRLMEDLGRTLFAAFRAEAEAQGRDHHRWSGPLFETARAGQV